MLLMHRAALVLLPLLVLLAGVLPGAQRPVPVLGAFERVAGRSGSALHVLVEPDRGVGWRLGMGFQCRPGSRPVVAAFLGPFPPDRRSVQLAVRNPASTVVAVGAPADCRAACRVRGQTGTGIAFGFYSLRTCAIARPPPDLGRRPPAVPR